MPELFGRCLPVIGNSFLIANVVFFITWFLAPKPEFEEKDYTEEELWRQDEILNDYKKMMWRRFVLFNCFPCLMLVGTICFYFTKCANLINAWEQLNNGFSNLITTATCYSEQCFLPLNCVFWRKAPKYVL